MKHFIFSALVAVSAQAEMRVGATGGGAWGTWENHWSRGFSGGVSARWSSGQFAVQVDVLYSSQDGEYVTAFWRDAEYEFGRVVVPLGVSFTPNPAWLFAPCLVGGLEFAYQGQSAFTVYEYNGEAELYEGSYLDKRWDLGPMLGASLMFHDAFEVAARVSWGLRDHLESLSSPTLVLLGTLWFPL